MEGGAGIVGESDPAVEIGGFVVAGDGEDVVCVPGKIVGEIRGFDLLFARAGIFERHEKRGAVIEIRGDVGEAIAFGVGAGDDVVADFPDLAVVVGEKRGFDFFVLRGAAVLIRADEGDFAADVFVEELGGLEEIVFVILLEDAELIGIGERAEVNGGGIDGGGDVHEFEAEGPVGESEIADVADESDVGIVDGDVQIGLVAETGGLIGRGGARRFFFLRGFVLGGENVLPTASGIKECGSGEQDSRAGENPGQAALDF